MNGAALRNLAITVVLAGLAAFVGARLASQRPESAEACSRFMLRDSVYDVVHQDLKLTPVQARQIDDIEMRYAHRRNALRVAMGASDAELGQALANEMALGTQAEQALDRLQTAMGSLQKETVLYVLAVRAVLTPQQQQVLDQKVFDALTQGRL